MKPRTKFEKAVIAQSGHLRPLATAPRRWALTLKVVQCRAACNKVSEYQQGIEKAIESHQKEIKARLTA